jgi:hypothetical protein
VDSSQHLREVPHLRWRISLLIVDSVRALGETDVNPASVVGKLSQLVFTWIQPGNIAANLIAGGIAEAGAQQ